MAHSNQSHPGPRSHWRCLKGQKTLSLTFDCMETLKTVQFDNAFNGESEVIEVLVRLAKRERWDLAAIRSQLLQDS